MKRPITCSPSHRKDQVWEMTPWAPKRPRLNGSLLPDSQKTFPTVRSEFIIGKRNRSLQYRLVLQWLFVYPHLLKAKPNDMTDIHYTHQPHNIWIKRQSLVCSRVKQVLSLLCGLRPAKALQRTVKTPMGSLRIICCVTPLSATMTQNIHHQRTTSFDRRKH